MFRPARTQDAAHHAVWLVTAKKMLPENTRNTVLTTAVAIIWRAEDGDHILVVAPVVALHDQLVCPCNQGQLICVVELL